MMWQSPGTEVHDGKVKKGCSRSCLTCMDNKDFSHANILVRIWGSQHQRMLCGLDPQSDESNQNMLIDFKGCQSKF